MVFALSTPPISPPVVLSIAGSDPSGGAGIQADLKAFQSLGVYGMTCITALTVQNTKGVTDIHNVPPAFVASQLRSVAEDIPPKAIKTGMLSNAQIVEQISGTLHDLYPSKESRPTIIIDPVTVSTSGHTLLAESAIASLKTHLFPLGTLLTPNILEAQMLLGGDFKILDVAGMLEAGVRLAELGCPNVLVKGGHLQLPMSDVRAQIKALEESGARLTLLWQAEEEILILKEMEKDSRTEKNKVVVDLLVEADGSATAIMSNAIDSTSTHGTGCTLSASIAAYAARGMSIRDATIAGTSYTHSAIASAVPYGSGSGPVNHAVSILPRPLPPPSKLDPYPFTTHLIRTVQPLWDAYVNHPFVVQLANGTLDRRRFEHYIIQDYHYLRHYARAHGLAASKTTDFEEINAFATIALHIARESSMHVKYCESFGVSLPDLLATPETPATAAYALYILDCGHKGDVLDLVLAVASCALGYGEVGLRLRAGLERGDGSVVQEGNLYKQWIADYAGDEFQAAVAASVSSLERRIAAAPPTVARLAELTKIWEDCTRLEIGFWDGAMNLVLD